MVSIHAPAWGATIYFFPHIPNLLRFNPRARVGRDLTSLNRRQGLEKFQSTRPRGARHGIVDKVVDDTDGFNPRARVGRDRKNPHGIVRPYKGFNPRARVGRDLLIKRIRPR